MSGRLITNPVKEGYLEKRSRVFQKLRKRWMVLQGMTLYGFKSAEVNEEPAEIIDLNIFSHAKAESESDRTSTTFELSCPSSKERHSHCFVASSVAERNDWVLHLKQQIAQKQNNSSNNSSNNNNNNSNKPEIIKTKSVGITSPLPTPTNLSSRPLSTPNLHSPIEESEVTNSNEVKKKTQKQKESEKEKRIEKQTEKQKQKQKNKPNENNDGNENDNDNDNDNNNNNNGKNKDKKVDSKNGNKNIKTKPVLRNSSDNLLTTIQVQSTTNLKPTVDKKAIRRSTPDIVGELFDEKTNDTNKTKSRPTHKKNVIQISTLSSIKTPIKRKKSQSVDANATPVDLILDLAATESHEKITPSKKNHTSAPLTLNNKPNVTLATMQTGLSAKNKEPTQDMSFERESRKSANIKKENQSKLINGKSKSKSTHKENGNQEHHNIVNEENENENENQPAINNSEKKVLNNKKSQNLKIASSNVTQEDKRVSRSKTPVMQPEKPLKVGTLSTLNLAPVITTKSPLRNNDGREEKQRSKSITVRSPSAQDDEEEQEQGKKKNNKKGPSQRRVERNQGNDNDLILEIPQLRHVSSTPVSHSPVEDNKKTPSPFDKRNRLFGGLPSPAPTKLQKKRQSQPQLTLTAQMFQSASISDFESSSQDGFAPIGKAYSMIFEDRPFGLGLVAFEKKDQTGAIVIENKSIQPCRLGSRILSINGQRCRDLPYDQIAQLLRKALLPCEIRLICERNVSRAKEEPPTTTLPATATSLMAPLTLNGPRDIKLARTPPPAANLLAPRKPQVRAGRTVSPAPTRLAMSHSVSYLSTPTAQATPVGRDHYALASDISQKSENLSMDESADNDESESQSQTDTSLGHAPPELAKKRSMENPIIKQGAIKQQIEVMKQKGFMRTPKDDMESDVLQVLQQMDGYTLLKEAEEAEVEGELGDAVALYQEAVNTMNECLKHLEINAHLKKQVREQISSFERKSQILRRRWVTDQAKLEGRRGALDRQRSKEQKTDANSSSSTTSNTETKTPVVRHHASLPNVANPTGRPSVKTPMTASTRLLNSTSTKKNQSESTTNDRSRRGPTSISRRDIGPSKTEADDESDDPKKVDEKDNKKGLLSKQDDEFRGRIEAEIIDEVPDVSFKDVQGLTGVKLVLYESVILPQLRPEIFTGLRSPTAGLLLFGPPGNGKTMIAKCVATECNATFFSISASSITSKFVGDAERIMRTLFTIAREKAPSIIFIDEIDSLLTARGGQNEAESSRRIKTEFLIQFDGVHKASEAEARMLVIGATNLPHQLDDAVLRRFSKRIMVPLPDEETRYALLQNLMKKQRCEMTPWDMKDVVKKTDGYSFSDLTLLCKDAAMGPVRELGAKIMNASHEDIPPISRKHFMRSLENVRPSVPEKSIAQYVEWNEKYGSQVRLHASALPESMRPELTDMPRTPVEEEEKEKEKEKNDKQLLNFSKNKKTKTSG